MKKLLTLVFTLFLGISFLQAQNFLDKLDNALNKVDRAANSAEKAGKTSGKLMGFFGKDKNGGKTENTMGTIIKVEGASFASLSTLNDKIKACIGIEETKMNYKKEGSVIAVKTKLSTEEVLTAIKKAGAIKDENISGLDENSISVTLK